MKRLDGDVREKPRLRWDQAGREETQDVISDGFFFASVQFANYLLFIVGHTCQSTKSFLMHLSLAAAGPAGVAAWRQWLEVEYMAASTQ